MVNTKRLIHCAIKQKAHHVDHHDLDRFSSHAAKPWLNANGEDLHWPGPRIAVAKIVCNHGFDKFMSLVIAFNALLIIVETDMSAQCYPAYANNLSECPFTAGKRAWVVYANLSLLSLYTFEALTRIYVYRLAFIFDHWNQLDTFIVMAGWVGVFSQGNNLNYLRMIRFTRLMRAFQVLRNIRELYLLISGMGSALKAVFISCFLLFCMLLGFAIAMVECVHPVSSQISIQDCFECKEAFSTVSKSVLTLFKELIAGGSWLFSVKLISNNMLVTFLILLATTTISLGILNLILTVIVERAAEARENDVQDRARQKCLSQAEARDDLLKICHHMDTDHSGRISLDIVVHAFENSEEFYNLMTVMDLDLEELREVFQQADRGRTGNIPYEEFVDELFHLKFQNQHVQMGMLRHRILESNYRMEKHLSSQIAAIDLELREIKSHMQDLVGASGITGARVQTHSAYPEQPWSSGDVRPSALMYPSGRYFSSMSTAEIQSQETIQPLQEEVKQLLEYGADLVRKAAKSLDPCSDKLTDAVQNLIKNQGCTTTQGIRTLEVWLASRKIEECKCANESLLQACGSYHDDFFGHHKCQYMLSRAARYLSQKAVQCKLTSLLPQLLDLSTPDLLDMSASYGNSAWHPDD